MNADRHPPTSPSTSPQSSAVAASRAAHAGMRALVTIIGLLLAGVIVAPIALSSQDIVAWAGAPHGLGLAHPWDLITFLALDAAAAVCVGMVVVAAWRGEPAGAFGLLVWAFAAGSAWANYRQGTRPGAPDDAWWFFPAMSVAGPALLEVTVRRVRRWVQTAAGRYEPPLPHFRLARWLVALPETARAWRLAVTEGYPRPQDAITAARTRQPQRKPPNDGSREAPATAPNPPGRPRPARAGGVRTKRADKRGRALGAGREEVLAAAREVSREIGRPAGKDVLQARLGISEHQARQLAKTLRSLPPPTADTAGRNGATPDSPPPVREGDDAR